MPPRSNRRWNTHLRIYAGSPRCARNAIKPTRCIQSGATATCPRGRESQLNASGIRAVNFQPLAPPRTRREFLVPQIATLSQPQVYLNVTQAKRMSSLMLLNHFYPVISHRRVRKKERATNCRVRFEPVCQRQGGLISTDCSRELNLKEIFSFTVFNFCKKQKNVCTTLRTVFVAQLSPASLIVLAISETTVVESKSKWIF